MPVNMRQVGEQIASLRKAKGLTQSDLGERLSISFQAVSKWERGESLPDTALLPELAAMLDTTVDHLLSGGERALRFRGKCSAKDALAGVDCLRRAGLMLGKQNPVYRGAIDGLSERMNSDVETMLEDGFLRECLAVEAIIQNMKQGYYYDMTEAQSVLSHDKWRGVLCEHARIYGML